MILNKSELIIHALKGINFSPDIKKRIVTYYRCMPDNLFIPFIKKETNYKIEPIRKNLYIIT